MAKSEITRNMLPSINFLNLKLFLTEKIIIKSCSSNIGIVSKYVCIDISIVNLSVFTIVMEKTRPSDECLAR